MPVIPALGSKRQEKKSKVILGYIASLRPAWATRDPTPAPNLNERNA